MNPRHLIGLTVLSLTLAACGGIRSLTYDVRTNLSDSSKYADLFRATERVMVRRLAAAGVKDPKVTVLPSGSGSAVLTMKLPDAAGSDTAKRILSETFTFDIRVEGPKKPDQKADETNWLPTGVEGTDLLWIVPISNPTTKEIGVELQFSEAGRLLLEKAFKGNVGKHIGIFVRDLLVSKMTISTETLTDHIIISGIPSEHVAEIFADDVNVGIHAIFTPAP